MILFKGNLLAETLTVDLFLMEANRKLSLPPTPTQAEKLHMHTLMLRIGSLNNG